MLRLVYALVLLPLLPMALELGWGVPGSQRTAYLLPDSSTSATSSEEIIHKIASDTRQVVDTRENMLITGKPDNGWDEGRKLRAMRRGLLFSENPDEMLVLAGLAAMKPKQLSLNPRNYTYGWPFFMLNGAAIGMAKVTGFATLSSDPLYYLNNPGEFGKLYIAGRVLNLLFVLVLWFASMRTASILGANRELSCVIATLVCMLPGVLIWGAVMKPHLPAAALGMLCVERGLAFFQASRSRARDYYLAVILVALAAAMQYSMVIMALFPASALIIKNNFINKERPFLSIRQLLLGALIGGVLCCVLNPYHLLNLSSMLKDTAHTGAMHPFTLSFNVFPQALLLVLVVFGAGGMAAFLCMMGQGLRRGFAGNYAVSGRLIKVWWGLIVLLILFCSAFTLSEYLNGNTARFILFLAPLATVLMLVPLCRNGSRFLFWGVCALFAANALYLSLAHRVCAPSSPQSVEAASYIRQHIPAGATIRLDADYAPFRFPPLNLLNYTIKTYEGTLQENEYLLSISPRNEPAHTPVVWANPYPYLFASFIHRPIYLYLPTGKLSQGASLR